MSADNGIYILKTRDNQYRVIHATAIGNLYYSFHDSDDESKELIPTRIIEYFGQSEFTYDKNLARHIAFNMMKNLRYVEYGIREIPVNKTWDQIINEAKELAPLEIEALKRKGLSEHWEKEISQLEEIINM